MFRKYPQHPTQYPPQPPDPHSTPTQGRPDLTPTRAPRPPLAPNPPLSRPAAEPAHCAYCCPLHGEAARHHDVVHLAQLDRIEKLLAQTVEKHPHQELVVIGLNNPYIVRSFGRRHTRVWVSTPQQVTYSDLSTAVTWAAGWNVLDVPELTVITGTTATPFNARYEATDYPV